jgi:hypothetical protein
MKFLKYSILFLVLNCAFLGSLSAQVDSVTVLDPQDFSSILTLTDNNFYLISRRSDTWRKIEPVDLREYVTLNVDRSRTTAPDSTGNIVDLFKFQLTLGDSVYVVDGDGDAALLFDPTQTQELSISNDTLYISGVSTPIYLGGYETVTRDTTLAGDGTAADPLSINQQGATAGQVLKWNGTRWAPDTDNTAGAGAGEINQGANVGGENEVYKTKTDTTLVFRTIGVSGGLITATQTDTTIVLAGVSDDNQTVDTFSYLSGIITLALQDDGEAPYTVDISSVNTERTDEEIEDLAGVMFSGNTETLITATYQDSDGTVDLVVEDDLSLYDNATSGFTTNTILQDSTAAIRGDMVRNLDDLLDVTITTPADSALVFWDNANSLWIDGPTIDEIRGSGGGTDDQVASEVDITDSGGYYTGTEVETALQEIGADIASLTAGGIPTRYNYAALRSSPPTDSIVLITEPGYAGLFIRVSTGTEDSGVTIKDNNNDYWDRVRDPGYYNVNWYKLGGPCENSQINNILVTYSDVLNMIMDNSGGNCTVDFSNGNEASIYTFDTRVDLQENVRFIGQGDTLRRNDAIWTTVTSAGTTGESSITVADTTGFRKGQRISVSTYRSQNGILVSKKLIGSTAANTINLSGTIESDIAVGDTVFTCFPMFNNTDGLELGDVVFDGLVFDGNWRNNPYTNSWNQAPTINILNNFGSHTTINNCKFYDTPCENVITAASTVTNCEASNLAGSFFHLSGVVDTAFQVLIENCWVYDVCMVGDDTTGHSEAAIVSSGSPLSIRMNNCYFFNGSEAVFGDLGGDTDWWNIQGIRAENFRYVTWGVTNNAKIEGFRLRDSYFLNCNRFEGTGGSALDGEGFVDAVIDNNTFINTAVRIEGSRNMKFTNNKLLYEPSEGGFTNYIEDGLPYLDAMAYFSDFAHLDFSGNILRSDTITMTDTLVYGVIFDCTDMTDNGVSSEYFLSYGLNCTNNEILHFQRGITCDTAVVDPFAGDNRRNRAWHDWNINNNKVQMLQQSNANSWGILIGPGMEANYNTIYTSGDTTLTTIWPIFAYGIDDILNIDDNLPGATIMHNQIIGPWDFAQSIHSIFIGGDTSTNEGGFNCIVEYNLTPTPISGGGAIQSPAISRILYNRLISEELPGMTAPVFAPPLNYEY